MLLRSRSFVAARLPRCSFVRCCAAVVQSPPVSPHASQRHTAHVHAPISPRGEERRIKAVALCTRICPQISPKCIHPRSLSSSSSSPSSSTEVSACNDYRCSAASLHPSIGSLFPRKRRKRIKCRTQLCFILILARSRGSSKASDRARAELTY